MTGDYFRIEDDLRFPNRWQLDCHTADGEDVWDTFSVGKRAVVDVPLRGQLVSAGTPLDYTVAGSNVPVASARLANTVMAIAGEDVQQLPIAIADHPGDYLVLNSIRVLDCFDESRSEFSKWTREDHRPDKAGDYRSVVKLRIVPSRAAGAHFFRIARWNVPLIVSDELKAAIEARGLVGVLFESVTE